VTKEPVVLVHGLAGSTDWWRGTVDELSQEREVHAVAVPRLSIGDAVEWLVGRLDERRPAAIVGHSLGGLLALRTAARAPERVSRVVAISPAGIFGSPRRRAHVVPLLRALVGIPPRYLPMIVRDAVRTGPFRVWRTSKELLASDVRPELASIPVPTLLVWGERDKLVPPSLGETFRAEIPDCRLAVIPRAGHVPMLDAPEALNAELRRFLDERG
jgi:pimeloyl-ACP methyl ester carboxylesterase